MLRLSRYLLLALATLLAAPLSAQPTQAQYDSLVARVALLDSIVGTRGFMSPQLVCEVMNDNRPAEFPSGEYDLYFRNRQFGCAFDIVERNAAKVGDLGSHATVQSYVNAAVASAVSALNLDVYTAPPSSNLSHYLAGDVRIDGRLCIGASCIDGVTNQIQIFGDESSGIYFESNRNLQQSQLALAHWGEFGLQADGGMRMNNNFRSVHGALSTDNVRPWSSYGPDSQGTWSGQQRRPDFAHDNTQDWWVSIDEYTKTISIQSPRPGWKWALVTSSGLITLDKWHFPPCCN